MNKRGYEIDGDMPLLILMMVWLILAIGILVLDQVGVEIKERCNVEYGMGKWYIHNESECIDSNECSLCNVTVYGIDSCTHPLKDLVVVGNVK